MLLYACFHNNNELTKDTNIQLFLYHTQMILPNKRNSFLAHQVFGNTHIYLNTTYIFLEPIDVLVQELSYTI